MKPVIVYVDDEPNNLVVFEASVPEEWQVHTFASAVDALKSLRALDPWVLVSDQRMPSMTGLEFLELAAQLVPHATRMVVTGQTAEQTIVQLIRRARIFDYITKPWDPEDLVARIENGIALNRSYVERLQLTEELKRKVQELEEASHHQARMASQLADAKATEGALRAELEKWVPPQIVSAVKDGQLVFPMKKEIVGIAFDIVNSSSIHDNQFLDRPLRSQILSRFTETVIRNGGIRESHSGDSAYGHFGAFFQYQDPVVSALAAAREFRVSLRSLQSLSSTPVECGIAVHVIPDTIIQIHEIKVTTQFGEIVQKSFDTQSPHIDLLHRMEKLVHALPGSNIIISQSVFDRLGGAQANLVPLGRALLKGQRDDVMLYLIPSDKVTAENLQAFIAQNFGPSGSLAAA
jgi:CheY-like chemotaxis protein/class 3 adenylate cyclase